MITAPVEMMRTRRKEVSPKVREVSLQHEMIAKNALLRAYPSIPGFGVEICILDRDDSLELFWWIFNLGGERPGGWVQVKDLTVCFRNQADGTEQEIRLEDHVAGFHAWYRMRGGMISTLPHSRYLNLKAGRYDVIVRGRLQNTRALCLFADAFGDLFHEHHIREYFQEIRSKLRKAKLAADIDPSPERSFQIPSGAFNLRGDRTGKILHRQADRLHQVPVSYEDVREESVPRVDTPHSTELDPVNFFRSKLYYLHEQSTRYQFCPYDTVNHWEAPPSFDRSHYHVNERTAYFHIEALVPLYRATGDPEVYYSARKWYETIVRNIWPCPGGGTSLVCGDRTVFGSALHLGGTGDAICTFAAIDGNPDWVEPARSALRSWPMHPTIPRPVMDQDAWGNEEMNTTGTYNMCTHFALANWRVGRIAQDADLCARAETILTQYTFPAEQDGIWPYRAGDYPSHHYDMYLKWQLGRLLLTSSERWTADRAFLDLMRRAMDATLSYYAKPNDDELLFPDWTHNPNERHPGNSARHAAQQLEVLFALTIHIDEGYIEPMLRVLRGLYRLLALPEVDRCWHGSWFHVHGNLLSLARHGFHLEGKTIAEMRIARC